MRTKASVSWFPLHAALVVVPLGALAAVVALDALHILTSDDAWYRGAFVVTAVAAAGVFAAMVSGLIDYFANVPRRGEVWKHANVHMVLGLALVGYVIGLAAGRWATLPGPRPTGAWTALAANLVGLALLLAQGVIGRGLVLRHYLTVEKEHHPELPPGVERPELEPAKGVPSRMDADASDERGDGRG